MEGIHKIELDTQYVIHLCLAHTQKLARLNHTKRGRSEKFEKTIILLLWYPSEEL